MGGCDFKDTILPVEACFFLLLLSNGVCDTGRLSIGTVSDLAGSCSLIPTDACAAQYNAEVDSTHEGYAHSVFWILHSYGKRDTMDDWVAHDSHILP